MDRNKIGRGGASRRGIECGLRNVHCEMGSFSQLEFHNALTAKYMPRVSTGKKRGRRVRRRLGKGEPRRRWRALWLRTSVSVERSVSPCIRCEFLVPDRGKNGTGRSPIRSPTLPGVEGVSVTLAG